MDVHSIHCQVASNLHGGTEKSGGRRPVLFSVRACVRVCVRACVCVCVCVCVCRCAWACASGWRSFCACRDRTSPSAATPTRPMSAPHGVPLPDPHPTRAVTRPLPTRNPPRRCRPRAPSCSSGSPRAASPSSSLYYQNPVSPLRDDTGSHFLTRDPRDPSVN